MKTTIKLRLCKTILPVLSQMIETSDLS